MVNRTASPRVQQMMQGKQVKAWATSASAAWPNADVFVRMRAPRKVTTH